MNRIWGADETTTDSTLTTEQANAEAIERASKTSTFTNIFATGADSIAKVFGLGAYSSSSTKPATSPGTNIMLTTPTTPGGFPGWILPAAGIGLAAVLLMGKKK